MTEPRWPPCGYLGADAVETPGLESMTGSLGAEHSLILLGNVFPRMPNFADYSGSDYSAQPLQASPWFGGPRCPLQSDCSRLQQPWSCCGGIVSSRCVGR